MVFAAPTCSRALLRTLQIRSGGVRGAVTPNAAVLMVGGPQQRLFLFGRVVLDGRVLLGDGRGVFLGGRGVFLDGTSAFQQNLRVRGLSSAIYQTTGPLSTLSPSFSSLSQSRPTLLLTNSVSSSFSTFEQESTNDRQLVVYRGVGAPPPCRFSLESFMTVVVHLYKRGVVLPAIRACVQEKEITKARVAWQKALVSLVHKEFNKAYRKHLRLDNKTERKALKEYTGGVYKVINSSLRSGSVVPEVKEKVDWISSALSKLSKADPNMVYKGTVYRGTDLPTNIKDSLQPGATYSDPAFFSTSMKPEQAQAFSKGIVFQIESKTGVNVAKKSNIPSEAEILFRPCTLFMIKSREEVDHSLFGRVTLIVMDEIH